LQHGSWSLRYNRRSQASSSEAQITLLSIYLERRGEFEKTTRPRPLTLTPSAPLSLDFLQYHSQDKLLACETFNTHRHLFLVHYQHTLPATTCDDFYSFPICIPEPASSASTPSSSNANIFHVTVPTLLNDSRVSVHSTDDFEAPCRRADNTRGSKSFMALHLDRAAYWDIWCLFISYPLLGSVSSVWSDIVSSCFFPWATKNGTHHQEQNLGCFGWEKNHRYCLDWSAYRLAILGIIYTCFSC